MTDFFRVPRRLGVALCLLAAGCGDTQNDPLETTEASIQPLTLSLQLTPAAIRVGESAELSWSAPLATGCVAEGDWQGVRPAAGSETVSPTGAGTYTYRLRCSRPGESVERGATLQVFPLPPAPPPPPQPGLAVEISFSADRTEVVLGLKTLLSWSAAHASGCTAAGAWSGSRPVSGSELITPAAIGPQHYQLDCAGEGAPDSASVTVTVLPPPDPFAEARTEFDRLRQLETRTDSP